MGKEPRKKDKKITFLKKSKEKSKAGYPINKPPIPIEGLENIWAYYRHVSAKEYFAAAAFHTKIEVIFEIRWRDDIDKNMKIRYKGKDYSITRIDDYEGYKQNLRIYAYVG